MAEHHYPSPLQGRAARLEQELAAVRKVQETLGVLRETFDMFPGLREDFAAEMQVIALGEDSPTPVAPPERPRSAPQIADSGIRKAPAPGPTFTRGTNRERIEAFLAARLNRPATVEEISEATGVPPASIRHLFSTRFPGAFVTVEVEGARLKHWRMSPMLHRLRSAPLASDAADAGGPPYEPAEDDEEPPYEPHE